MDECRPPRSSSSFLLLLLRRRGRAIDDRSHIDPPAACRCGCSSCGCGPHRSSGSRSPTRPRARDGLSLLNDYSALSCPHIIVILPPSPLFSPRRMTRLITRIVYYKSSSYYLPARGGGAVRRVFLGGGARRQRPPSGRPIFGAVPAFCCGQLPRQQGGCPTRQCVGWGRSPARGRALILPGGARRPARHESSLK